MDLNFSTKANQIFFWQLERVKSAAMSLKKPWLLNNPELQGILFDMMDEGDYGAMKLVMIVVVYLREIL